MNREILFRGKSIDNGEWVMSNFVCAGEDVAMVAFYKVLRNTIGRFRWGNGKKTNYNREYTR